MKVPAISKKALGTGGPQAGFMRGVEPRPLNASVQVSLNRPRDVSDDVRVAWANAAAHAIDALQNQGWIAGGVEAAISTIIGAGLRLNAQPDHEALGWTASEAAEWSKRVERRYEERCQSKYAIDASGRFTAGQLEAAHLRQWFATGEGLSQILLINRAGVPSRSRIRLLPSHWLTRETDQSRNLQQGVFLDRHGAPRAYRFSIKDATGLARTVDYAARDQFGRPIINHVFDGMPSQTRGITVFAPVLRTLQRYEMLSGATLKAALLHAVFAATLESDYPTEEVLAAIGGGDEPSFADFQEVATAHNKNVDIRLGEGGKIPHLLPGEHLKLQGSEHPNSNYEAFANFLLREIARCLGCLFEDLTGDYRGATYSSLQNGLAKNWPITLYRRQHIAVPFKQADYEAWLEDDIDQGNTPFPGGIDGFVRNRSAAVRASWVGPPKPVADELKAAKADQIYYGLGVKTQQRIAADRGDDIQDVHDQLQREADSRAARNLPDPTSQTASETGPADDREEEQAA